MAGPFSYLVIVTRVVDHLGKLILCDIEMLPLFLALFTKKTPFYIEWRFYLYW